MLALALPVMAAASLAATRACASTIIYEIRAYVDDRDLLIIDQNVLQWLHLGGGAAVGRFGGLNEPTIVSSAVDGVVQLDNVAWIPDWIERPPSEVRHDAYSSATAGLRPALPEAQMTVTLSVLEGDGNVNIGELPTAENGYRLVLEFLDSRAGPHWYDVRAIITTGEQAPSAPTSGG